MKVDRLRVDARTRVVSAALLLLLLAGGSSAQEGSPGASLDPMVSEIVAMLEGGVSGEIVLQWLEGSSRRPGELHGEDLIALSVAGADEELLGLVLRLASGGGADGAAAAETEAVPPADPPAVETTAGARLEEDPEPAQVRRSLVDVFFTLNYKPRWRQDEPRWDLFLYLDGDVLGRVPANDERTLVVLRRLESGWHRIVVAQETHERRAGSPPTWSHAARVSPVPIDFMLPTGRNLEVEVVFRQYLRSKKKRGPLHVRVLQGSKQLERQDQVGVPASQWLPFCEDVEAAAGKGAASEPCSGWTDLWGDFPALDFATVRLELARFDFAPPPLL